MSRTVELDERRSALKERFERERGALPAPLEALLVVDPDFFAAYLEVATTPWRTGTLEPKLKELIYLAVDASTTHLYGPGIRHHIRAAFDAGATPEEVLELLELVSIVGFHSVTMGMPVLLEAVGDGTGVDASDEPLDDRRQALKKQFARERGKWAPLLQALLVMDPDFFAAYLEMAAQPWRSGTLAPKFRELVYVAIDVNTAHLYEPGFRHHMQNALDQGATKEEVLEVLELVAEMGVHTMASALPVFLEECARRDRSAR